MPEEFNNYFLSIPHQQMEGVTIQSKLPESYFDDFDSSVLQFENVTGNQVANIIRNLDSHKSVGSDCIPVRFLKLCVNGIFTQITSLINQSISTAIVPKVKYLRELSILSYKITYCLMTY